MRIRQSFCFPCFKTDDCSFDRLCGVAADIGYAAIELWNRGAEFDELVAAARKHNLVIASMCGHQSLPDGLNKRSNHDRIEKELRASIDLAADLGIPGLICFSGNRNPGQSDDEAIGVVADGFKRVAGYAEKKQVNLNMELLNSRVDHPGYQCDHTEWGVKVCQAVASPRVKLLYDIYHMQIMEGDIIRTIQYAWRHIGHFHTAGNPGRKDMDDTQEMNYGAICKAIAETEYAYYVGHEFFAKGDKLEALRTAFKLCDRQ